MTVLKAHYDGKRVVLDEPADLKPNTRLKIIVEDERAAGKKAAGNEMDDLRSLFGKPIKTGIKDFTEQHDHYLYGTPKRPRK